MENIELLKAVFLLVVFFIFNKLCENYNFFSNNISISKHKNFVRKSHNVLIVGGFFLLLGNIIFQKKFFLDTKNLFYILHLTFYIFTTMNIYLIHNCIF
jgi:hypothetical protein